LDTEEELIRKKDRALYALQELLSHAKNNRPSRSDEISKIEKALEVLLFVGINMILSAIT
jgi:hypothetical protein